jgi:hypothetical protein
MSWRDESIRVIKETLAKYNLPYPCPVHGDVQQEKEARKLLNDAYPFYEKLHWPYKVWCEEVNKALGKPKNKKIKPHAPAGGMTCMMQWLEKQRN